MNLLLLQQAVEGDRGTDAGVVWRTLSGMGESHLARAPYILVALVVFGGFLLAGRVVRGVVYAAGQRTRLDATLADLLGRLASFVMAVLGLFVAAVIIFPAFKPGDLVAGLGTMSVVIGFAFIDMPFPHTVVLFHDATGSRDGDIERAKYLGARQAEESQDGDGGPRVQAGGAVETL